MAKPASNAGNFRAWGQGLGSGIVVISDLVQQQSDFSPADAPVFGTKPGNPLQCQVRGGYLERLPLAAVQAGLADFAEIWHYHRGTAITARTDAKNPFLTRRAFPLPDDRAPFQSDAMLDFIHAHGAPAILCVLGLGVSEAMLQACAASTIIYNSIDVPALRVPPSVSRHFDLVLTGAPWQSDDVVARHPGMATAVLPVGPEFASPETFYPIPGDKRYDVVYVAAAQPYKRHDILFDALARSPRPLKALCVMGYGEMGEALRLDAFSRGLDVDFVGPPGVSHHEVNRLINQARVGLVCGENDGAPAILTEYMLADLPVVANAALRCGLHYILPQTGLAASAGTFEQAILAALAGTQFSPRQTVLDRWAWPNSIATLGALIAAPQTTRFHQNNSVISGGRLERANLA